VGWDSAGGGRGAWRRPTLGRTRILLGRILLWRLRLSGILHRRRLWRKGSTPHVGGRPGGVAELRRSRPSRECRADRGPQYGDSGHGGLPLPGLWVAPRPRLLRGSGYMWNAAKTGTDGARIHVRRLARICRLALDQSLVARSPGLVVACRFGPPPLRQHRTAWPIRVRRAGQIGLVRFFPSVSYRILLRRRCVDDVMQPAMPAWRYQRCLGQTFIDHPAPVVAERRIDFAVLGS